MHTGCAPAELQSCVVDSDAQEAQLSASAQVAQGLLGRQARQRELFAALRRMSAEGGHDRWMHSGIAAALASADPRATAADAAEAL